MFTVTSKFHILSEPNKKSLINNKYLVLNLFLEFPNIMQKDLITYLSISGWKHSRAVFVNNCDISTIKNRSLNHSTVIDGSTVVDHVEILFCWHQFSFLAFLVRLGSSIICLQRQKNSTLFINTIIIIVNWLLIWSWWQWRLSVQFVWTISTKRTTLFQLIVDMYFTTNVLQIGYPGSDTFNKLVHKNIIFTYTSIYKNSCIL